MLHPEFLTKNGSYGGVILHFCKFHPHNAIKQHIQILYLYVLF